MRFSEQILSNYGLAGGIRSLFGGDDPTKPTPQEIKKANDFAKSFALRKHLISGEYTHTGGKVPGFYDASGKELNQMSALPPGTIMNISEIPPYVKNLEWDSESNVPYFIDEKTGYIQYVHPDIFRSTRFNPNRGMSLETIKSKFE